MLVGLDLASRLTGWCAGTGETVPACGAWEFGDHGTNYGATNQELVKGLEFLRMTYNPTVMLYEAPILRIDHREGFRSDSLHTLRKLIPLGVRVEEYCLDHGILCVEDNVKAIKKQLTGDQHADKKAMVAVARRVGLQLPAGEGAKDAADAFGCWYVAVRDYARHYLPRWDRAIWSPRGTFI